MSTETGLTTPDRSKNYLWVFLVFTIGVCLLMVLATGCFGLFAWGLGSLQQRVGANSTATIEAHSVQVTATHQAMAADRANFGFFETFDDNDNDWETGGFDDQYFKGEVKVSGGEYTWDFEKVYQEFSSSGGIHATPLYMTDFDVYVDGIARQAAGNDYCYGLRFRAKWVVDSWAFYSYLVCDVGTYSIFYYDGSEDHWLTLMSRQTIDTVHPGAWNTIGVIARGSHFKFLINDQVVHEMDDDHVDAGLIELIVAADGRRPGSISFDNFAAQGR